MNTIPPTAAADNPPPLTAPQAGNTGVLPTTPPLSATYLVDWLRFTLPASSDTETWLADHLPPTAPRPGSWRGWYDVCTWSLDGAIIGRCADPERASTEGVLVDINGRSLAVLGPERMREVLSYAVAHGHITRLDVATDDRAGHITRQRLVDAIADRHLVSRYRAVRWVTMRQLSHPAPLTGWTLYLGSAAGSSMIRIYDKAAEARAKGELPPGAQWVRVELEARDDQAHELARRVLADASAIATHIMAKVRVVDPTDDAGDSNRWRWPLATWWRDALGTSDRATPLATTPRLEKTIEHSARWFESSASATLAMLVEVLGDRWLSDVIEAGGQKLQPHHLAAIAYFDAMHQLAEAQPPPTAPIAPIATQEVPIP